MIYLASPYSHEQESVRHRRFLDTRDFTFMQLARGVPLFSPIVYGHQFSREYGAGTSHEDWLALNVAMMNAAEEMWVLCLDGWQESRGVAQELAHMQRLDKRITHKQSPSKMPPL